MVFDNFDQILQAMVPGLPKAQRNTLGMPWLVGQFVMTWGKHERMLCALISSIKDIDYEQLRDSMLDKHISQYEKEISICIEKIGKEHMVTTFLQHIKSEHVELRSFRNDIVHGYFGSIGPNEEFLLDRKLRKSERIVKELTLEAVGRAYGRLDQLGIKIINAKRVFEGREPIENV